MWSKWLALFGLFGLFSLDDLFKMDDDVIVDPSSLRVRQLKTLLNSRGTSHFGLTEKSQLVALVHSSGVLSAGELMTSSDWENAGLSKDDYFPSAKTLHKDVKRGMCRVWLLNVVPQKTLDVQWKASGEWEMVRLLFQHLGIKTGHSKCYSDTDVCGEQQRLTNQMVLVVPQRESNTRCHLVTQSVQSYRGVDSVLEWVQDELAQHVKTIESELELETNWMQFNNTAIGVGTGVRVVLIQPANGERPPVFYSSLAIAFENEVSFGVIEQVHAGPLYKHLPPHVRTEKHLARYVIITAQGVHEYGSRTEEHLNFKTMESTLVDTLLPIPPLKGSDLRCFTMFTSSWRPRKPSVGTALNPIDTFVNVKNSDIWGLAVLALLLSLAVSLSQEKRLRDKRLEELARQVQSLPRHPPLLDEDPPEEPTRRPQFAGLVEFRRYLERLRQTEHIPTQPEPLFAPENEEPSQDVRIEFLTLLGEYLEIMGRRQFRQPKDVASDDGDPFAYLDSLPRWTHPRQEEGLNSGSTTDIICVICREDYQDNDQLNGLPCGHNYHVVCIQQWISLDNHLCPMCKSPTNKNTMTNR